MKLLARQAVLHAFQQREYRLPSFFRPAHATGCRLWNEPAMRREEVEARCGIARSTIYRLMNEGLFPQQLKIGARAVRWLESEIIIWLASLPRAAG